MVRKFHNISKFSLENNNQNIPENVNLRNLQEESMKTLFGEILFETLCLLLSIISAAVRVQLFTEHKDSGLNMYTISSLKSVGCSLFLQICLRSNRVNDARIALFQNEQKAARTVGLKHSRVSQCMCIIRVKNP